MVVLHTLMIYDLRKGSHAFIWVCFSVIQQDYKKKPLFPSYVLSSKFSKEVTVEDLTDVVANMLMMNL